MATPIPKNRARFTVDEVARATGGAVVVRGASASAAVGVASDSRAVTTGSVFVALRGETHDGHAFAAAAAKKGATVLVLERGPAADLASADLSGAHVVAVDDTLLAWGDLAGAHLARWRSRALDPAVVAITGSAGKTTTKELTAALLAAVAPTHLTAGNLNNRVGVPAVVFALDETHRFAVLEMGMSLPGELDAITRFAHPDVSLVTNVGLAHAEGVGGLDGVMREKGAVYRALDERGVAVVNADDERARRAAETTRAARTVTFGRAVGARYRLVSREPEGAGSRVLVDAAGRELTVHLPLAGEVAAIDLVAAIAAQEAASGEPLPSAAIERALAGVRLSGRAGVRALAGETLLIDDTYNANPGSMRAALSTLGELARGRRKVAILGEMKELGAHAEAEHDALGDAVADAGVALVIGCGGLTGRTLDRAAARGVEVVRCATTDEAAGAATSRVRPGDAVLVKASRSVGAERVVAALVSEMTEVLPDAGKSASSGAS